MGVRCKLFWFSLWFFLNDFGCMCVFLAALEILANRFVVVGLVSRQELCNRLLNCCDLLDSPPLLQWHKCSPSCRTPLFSSLRKKLCFFYIWFPLFPYFFYICRKMLKMWDRFLDSLDIWFCWDNLPPCGLGSFGHNFHMSDVLFSSPCSAHTYDI